MLCYRIAFELDDPEASKQYKSTWALHLCFQNWNSTKSKSCQEVYISSTTYYTQKLVSEIFMYQKTFEVSHVKWDTTFSYFLNAKGMTI